MKKSIVLFCSCFLIAFSFGQHMPSEIAIIPRPVSIVENTGFFVLPPHIVIEAATQPELKQVIAFLKDRLSTPTGIPVTINNIAPTATIKLVLNKKADPLIGNEGYHLVTTLQNISIKANAPAGLFYGAQTLVQLFPKEVESAVPVTGIKWRVPCVSVTDYPRFGWRGLMFDVSRHFFTKQDVKQYIDRMVRYKYNLLHLHLTDDEGWRIEIKGLPETNRSRCLAGKQSRLFRHFCCPHTG